MDQSIIDTYYLIKANKEIPPSTIFNIFHYQYTPPTIIDDFDFTLLVDFFTKCLLTCMKVIPITDSIDVSSMPNRHPKLIDNMISVYNKCSKSKHIDIDKAVTFFNTYCIIKTICYIQHNFHFSNYIFSKYLLSILFNNGNLHSIINYKRYTIYSDFVVKIHTTHNQLPNSIISSTTHSEHALVSNNFPSLHNHIITLNAYSHIPQFMNVWIPSILSLASTIKSNQYYPKNHPLSILSNPNSPDLINVFRSYFSLTDTFIKFL